MNRCECCGAEVRRLREYQTNYGDGSSAVMVCSNCFDEAISISRELLANAGAIAFEFAKGENSTSFAMQDKRRVLLQVFE